MMGGAIWVESSPGEGSTFFFTVRTSFREGTADRPYNAGVEILQGASVLVVDDNPTNRMILGKMLSLAGMKPLPVTGASEAHAALEKSCRERELFTIIILDVCMPEVDGLTLCGQIRQIPSTRRAKS